MSNGTLRQIHVKKDAHSQKQSGTILLRHVIKDVRKKILFGMNQRKFVKKNVVRLMKSITILLVNVINDVQILKPIGTLKQINVTKGALSINSG